MFQKEVYVRRREALVKSMQAAGQKGLMIFMGNIAVPSQGTVEGNGYSFRQDSTWIYFFGIDEPHWAATIDIETGEAKVFADDVDIDDIIWMGPQPSVASQAAEVGVSKSAPYHDWEKEIAAAREKGRTIHFLPQLRYYNKMRVAEAAGRPLEEFSVSMTRAVAEIRLIKEACEIEELDKVSDSGFRMHSAGRDAVRPGAREMEICGLMAGIAHSEGWGLSFATILTQHGETLHNHAHNGIVEPGKLMVIDAGVESLTHYASDHTRTYPTSGKFTTKQREIYQIVYDCNEYAFSLTKPGISYRDVHIATVKKMLEGLKALGLVKGDVDEMSAKGIGGLFMPHGLGHNMGLDVHDMEDLGENFVGYEEGQVRAKQLGLGNLRMARPLRAGHVITDEPGIYFIPDLIAKFKKEGLGYDFVNYQALEGYYDFGGIRLEDDVLVTADGARRLGTKRLPIAPDDIESIL